MVTYECGDMRQDVRSKKVLTREEAEAREKAVPARVRYSSEEAARKEREVLASHPKTLDFSGESGIIENKRRPSIRISMQFFAEKDIERQESGSLVRAIRKYERQIAKHEGYIRDPKSHCPGWDSYSEQKRKGLIRHWEKEIRNFRESIQNRVDELKRRGEL